MRRAIALVGSALLLAGASPAAAAGPDRTRAAISSQMRWAGAGSGALVVDLETGEEIYSSRADVYRVPASIEKLFTTSAALLALGPDAQLQTTLSTPATIDPAGLLDGNLYLRGGGDPTLDAAALDRLALDLVERTGLSEISGSVIGDESAFDALRGPPSSGYRTSAYVGPLSALIYNRGRTGRIRPYWQSRPALFAARELTRVLKGYGVRVSGPPRTGVTPTAAFALAVHTSPPMSTLVRLANVWSDNFVAETLIKALGASEGGQGTTAGGAALVRRTLAPLGVRPRVADGSGLSRSNRTSPRQVIRLLDEMTEEPTFADFYESLAIAGRTGTLRDRMRRGSARDRCRGKTGTLISVSGLAGYCELPDGRLVGFAFLMNGVNPYGARALQDRMVAAVARYRAP